ncbi:hypothetical protein DFQ27_004166, partial [Actinomortierella ambigua]
EDPHLQNASTTTHSSHEPTLASSDNPHSNEENHQRSLIARITTAALATTPDTKKGPLPPPPPPQTCPALRSTRRRSSNNHHHHHTATATTTPPVALSTVLYNMDQKKEVDTVADERPGQLALQKPQPADTVSRGDHAAAGSKVVPVVVVEKVANNATNLVSAATKSPVTTTTTCTIARPASAGMKRKFGNLADTQERREEKAALSDTTTSSVNDSNNESASSKVDNSETHTDPHGNTTLFDAVVDEIEDWSEEELKALQQLEDENEVAAPSKTDIPDNSCPICGIDLLSLNDVTPEGHVNRCLDRPPSPLPRETPSSGMDIDTPTPATTESTTVVLQSGSLISSVTAILGSVQQAVITTASSSFSSISNTVLATTSTTAMAATGKSSSTPSSTVPSSGKAVAKKPTRAPRPSKPCPFYKKMPDTTFTVDAFSYGCIPECTAYFLTHFHSDHYGGLTSTWKHGPIYCSSITANLVLSRLKVDPQYVRRLPMYEPTVVEGVTVRLLDANHCPGSVLFVFDLPATPSGGGGGVIGRSRRYLHTGDFRAHPSMISHPILRQPENPPIDILYLDTTYINPKYTFPPQDAVIEATAQMVAKELGIVGQSSCSSSSSSAAPSLSTAPAPAPPPKKKSSSIMESWLKRMDGNSEKLQGMKTSKQASSSSSSSSSAGITTTTVSTTRSSLSIWGTKRGSRGPTRYPGTWPEQMTANDGAKVLICVGTYLIGKERVFVAIAKALSSKIYVQPSKRQILGCLEDRALMAMLTDDPREAQVHLVHMGTDLSPANLQTYLEGLQPRFERVIAIRPTGWSFSSSSYKKEGPASAGAVVLKPSYVSERIKVYGVPYSEHSSFSELAGFVRSLQIAKVIPTVGVGTEKGRQTMRAWFDRWARERERGVRWWDVESGAGGEGEGEV